LIEPRTQGTLVGHAAIAVDGETGLPLRVAVTARGQAEPAFQSGFTSLSLEAPADTLFSFVPPPGATVKELQLPVTGTPPWPMTPGHPVLPGAVIPPDQGTTDPVPPEPAPNLVAPDKGTTDPVPPEPAPDYPAWSRPDTPKPSVTGSGWETVIGFPAPSAGQGSMLSESLLKDPFLAQAAVAVPGGRLLSTTLVNVLITDDGRIFVGMVPPERLQAAAGAVAK
jgi:hypothetical protein